MSAFGMIESFFFLSLGIVFILIVLLVYHFKQRIATVEQKSDTMFDIVQNLAKELTSVKSRLVVPSLGGGIYEPRIDREEEEAEEEEEESDEEEEEEESDEEESDAEDEESDRIKVIEIGEMNTIDNIQEPVEDNSSDSDTEPDIVELKEDESDKIKVLKMDNEIVSENDINAFKKMPVGELRTLAISKGLCSDASKLNKVELVKMLSKK